jgi:hypothetical protein
MWINIFEYLINNLSLSIINLNIFIFIFLTDHANKVLYIW